MQDTRKESRPPYCKNRMFIYLSSSIIVAWCLAILIVADDPIVETSNGRISGFRQNVAGTVVKTFLNIPFATPPIGDLRFKRPQPVSNWTGILMARSTGNSCHQLIFTTFQREQGEKGENMWNANTTRDEDCLQLNVWVPETPEESLTTMVWIFGGGFVYGTPTLDLYDGKMLASERGVIVVSINYRVGPLGFLYAGNENAPGNVGLLDQQLALKWIYTNIAAFGGKPGDITLFGESAGAASVSFHLMSAESRRYFQRGILQSGSALAHWAYQEPRVAKKYTKLLADKMGCTQTSDNDIVKCLRNKDPEELAIKQWELPLTELTFPFVPTLDNHFITQSPTDFFTSGNITNKDLLLGVNEQEAMYFLIYSLKNDLKWPNNGLDRTTFLKKLPAIVSQNGLEAQSNKSRAFLDAILYEYESHILPGETKDYMMLLDNIGGDFAFKCPLINLAKIYAKTFGSSNNIYVYSFGQRPSVSSWPRWTGVLHGDEIEFIFGLPLQNGANYTQNEQSFSADMMKYWSTFAKTGKPSEIWLPFTEDFEEYRILKADFANPYESTVRKGLKRRKCIFWSQYIPQLEKELEKAKSQNHGNCVNTSDRCVASLVVELLVCTVVLCILQRFHIR